jgi:hypothetical protein
MFSRQRHLADLLSLIPVVLLAAWVVIRSI